MKNLISGAVALALLGGGTTLRAETLVDTGFETGTDGFAYADDAFNGTAQPTYADGFRGTGGRTGQGLFVVLGGQDNANINGMSGAHSLSFSLAQATEVSIGIDYRLDMAGQYDNGESATALLNVDGAADSVVELARLDGVSGGNVPLSTGWQRAELELGTLDAGTHTIAVGGFNNRKTFNNEVTILALDNAVVSAADAMQLTGAVAGSDTSTIRNPNGYGKPNQTRLWFNTVANRWDAIVPRDDTAGNGSGVSAADHFLLEDVAGAQTFTDLELEDRDFARVDTFWDDDAAALYVLASHPTRTEFWRLGYDASMDSYKFEVGTTRVGVTVPGLTHPATFLGGSSPATLLATTGGTVYASVMTAERGLEVQYSDDGGSSWLATPVELNPEARLGVTTWVTFVDAGVQQAGVFAGENGENNVRTNYLFYAIATDEDPTNLAAWTDETTSLPEPFGNEMSDDHVSAAADSAGNLYFALKTESGNGPDPLIKLYRRDPAGDWSGWRVTATSEIPEQSRPSVMVDETRAELSVYVSGAEIVGPDEREAGRIRAPLDNLAALDSAPFEPIFSVPGVVFTDILSPRRAVNSDTGAVLLVHNRTDEAVWFAAETIEPAGVTETVLIDADFDDGRDGFGFADDVFLGTSQPRYSRGNRRARGGVTGGALQVRLGGRDNANIDGMSGGWRINFALDSAAEVELSFAWRLRMNANYEPDEFAQLMASVDGVNLAGEGSDYIARLVGDGNGGRAMDTRWQTFTVNLGVMATGDHRLTLGGFANRKTFIDELSRMRFDDVRVVAR